MDALTKHMIALEPELRAALVLEGSEAKEFEQTGEGAEVRSLLERVTLNDYLTPATNGVGTTGAAVELNAALKVPQAGKTSIAVPWQVLELRQVIEPGQTEQRAFTTTTSYGGGVMQRPILQRLFGPGIMDLLGVRIDSVPAGRTEWPLITGGAAPEWKLQRPHGTRAAQAHHEKIGCKTVSGHRLRLYSMSFVRTQQRPYTAHAPCR